MRGDAPRFRTSPPEAKVTKVDKSKWRKHKESWALEVDERVRRVSAEGQAELATWIHVAWEMAPKRVISKAPGAAIPRSLVSTNRQLRLVTRLMSDLQAGPVTRASLDSFRQVIDWGLLGEARPDWGRLRADPPGMVTQQRWWPALEAVAKD